MDTKALRQKILDLAIRGKLVPQDPNDEPAEVLLERIREQKQQMLKEGKLKKKDIKNDTIIFKGEDNLHYEKFQNGTVKCIEDEIPFEVPEGWAWARLQYIISLSSGKTIKVRQLTDEGDFPVYGGNGINGMYSYYNVEPKTIVIGRVGYYCGSVYKTISKAWVTDNALIATIKEPNIFDIDFLVSTLTYLNLGTTSVSTAQPVVSGKGILPLIVPIPPKKEQNRILRQIKKIAPLLDAIENSQKETLSLIANTKSKILDLAIRGKLVPQDPNDEPASVLLERMRAEKEELIKQGKIKRDKKESVIFKGDDNSYYEKFDGEVSCIDEEIPYNIPDTWTWMRLENCCVKEIRRGKSPKYAEISNVIVFAQKCNTKYNGIDISLAQYLDETTIKRYPTDEHMQDGDIVINSTGTGTLGRVGIYRNTDNTTGLLIVPDSHVTVIRSFSCISSHYLYAFMKAHQTELEKKGEGSTNQKELKPLTLKEMLIAVPPLSEQKRIDKSINVAFSHLAIIEKCLN